MHNNIGFINHKAFGRFASSSYGFETAIEKALEAGVDILAFANNSVYEEDVIARAVAVIKRLVQEGTISEERLEQSYQRIQRLKRRVHHSEVPAEN